MSYNFWRLFLISSFFVLYTYGYVTPEGKKYHDYEDTMHRNPDERLEIITKPPHPDELKEHWYKNAQDSIKNKISNKMFKPLETKAKNIIFFLGDGMGVSTVTAARIYKGQLQEDNKGGEEAELYMDSFPVLGSSKTFCSDRTVPDSACTATAYLCGVKANYQSMGLDNSAPPRNCTAQMNTETHVTSILQWSQEARKSTGIVTKSKITDASPGGNYAHIAYRYYRYWENDNEIRKDGENPDVCTDIAEQLIRELPGREINVLMGGGRRHFRDNSTQDHETGEAYHRTDGVDLIQEWIDGKNSSSSKYIQGKDELDQINLAETDHLFGLFAFDAMEYADEALANNNPNLTEMTRSALEILMRNPEGFYLFVEGARIDHAHHDNSAKKALTETLEFDEALKLADELTNDEDTLIIVTADHSHPFTLGGYPYRGNPIFESTKERLDQDGLPYAMLAYSNGPGYKYPELHDDPDSPDGKKCLRYDITQDESQFNDIEYQQRPHVKLGSATHAGEDVFIFAKGPWAHLLSGVNLQSYIPHVLGYAACVGPFDTYCDTMTTTTETETETTTDTTNTATETTTTTTTFTTEETSTTASSVHLIISIYSTILCLFISVFVY